MEKQYMLHPGRVISKTDRQEHFIDAPTLARLYGVKLHDCLIVPISDALYPGHSERLDVIHLYPKSNGDYKVPN
jgi:hypothetical protein